MIIVCIMLLKPWGGALKPKETSNVFVPTKKQTSLLSPPQGLVQN